MQQINQVGIADRGPSLSAVGEEEFQKFVE
jgi:hypothetical protein